MKDLKSFLRLQSESHWRPPATLEFIPRGSWSRKSVPPPPTRTEGITGTDSWAPEAYCRRRAAGPVRRTSQVAAVSLPSLPVPPLPPSTIHSLAVRPRGLQSTPEQSLITLPLVFPQRAHLVEPRFQARTDRMVRHGSLDFSSLSLPCIRLS